MAARKRKRSASASSGPRRPRPGRGAEPVTPESRADPAGPTRGPIVVGVGASAGGLEALRDFFTALPPDTGMSFVVIQHLDPTRESHSVELLARYTSMPVEVIANGMPVQGDHVYVMPPEAHVAYRGGGLHLVKLSGTRGLRLPVDLFFRSLAEQLGPCGAGIVLSGTGTDGTLGLKAIKAADGLSIAQDPASAKFAGMPRSAIETGAVSQVLRPQEMPDVLKRYAALPFVRCATIEEALTDENADGLQTVLNLLRTRTSHDFRCYKPNTLLRRIQRRMSLLHLLSFDDYARYLRDHSTELKALVADLLISVTDFFREPDAWTTLADQAIAPMIERTPGEQPLRIWVPGCATGEEAYSIAILLLERLQLSGRTTPLQIFATDVDDEALDYAREGVYPANIAHDLSPERLRRFFVKPEGDHHYQVNQVVREAVVFARQDLIADPPFSKLDLITCRNVLIYLKPEVQHKLISLLHFALREHGVLFLGNAETIGRHADLFEPISKKWRIYRRIGPARPSHVEFPLQTRAVESLRNPLPPAAREVPFARLADRLLVERYAPAAVLTNAQFEVLHFTGPTEGYLKQPSGPPTHDLFAILRDGLRAALRSALRQLTPDHPSVEVSAWVKRGSQRVPVVMTLTAVKAPESPGLHLLAFEDAGAAVAPPRTRGSVAGRPDALVEQLERDLETAREDLRGSVEQFEASHEELKASNEEIMSINEELQSANEELETSKEELQSLNEELTTVNAQLQSKIEELERAHNDQSNLLASSEICTICLDREQRIKWFTPAMAQLIRLQPSDLGRPIGDLASQFADDDLAREAQEVLRTLRPLRGDVESADGRWFVRRILPYRTSDDRIEGVVITFSEITEIKQTEQQLRESQQQLQLALLSSRVVVWRWEQATDALDATENFAQVYGQPPPPTMTHLRAWIHPEDRERYGQALTDAVQTGRTAPLDFRMTRPDTGALVWLEERTAILIDEPQHTRRVIGVVLDVTERRQALERLEKFNRELEQRVAERSGMLQLLSDIATSANQSEALPEAFRYALQRIGRHGGWTLGRAYLVQPETGALVQQEQYWDPESPLAQHVTERGDGAHPHWGDVLARSVLTSSEPVWRELSAREADEAGIPGERLTCGMAFAVRTGDDISGVLEFLGMGTPASSQRLLDVMSSIGMQLGRVAERQRYQLELSAALTSEQRRVGEDLHDTVGQELVGLALLAEETERQLRAIAAPQADRLQTLGAGLRRSLENVRTAVRGLAPFFDDGTGLSFALGELVQTVAARYKVHCTFECPEAISARRADTATHLYRIAGEALSNACRHAQARRIVLRLAPEKDMIRLEVFDDGVGMPAEKHASGKGLRFMRHRAKLIGARFTLGSGPAGGTQVVCVLPQDQFIRDAEVDHECKSRPDRG